MNISAITSYSNFYNSKTKQQAKMLSFKNYNDAFKKAITAPIKNKKDVEQLFHNLMKTECDSFTLSTWFKDLYQTYKNASDPILKILKNLYKDGAIGYNSKSETVFSHGDSIFFTGNEMNDFLEFSYDNNDGLKFSRGDDISANIITFFPNSNNMKKYKTVSGSGIGQISETTYYNEDGRKRHFRNFINSILGV